MRVNKDGLLVLLAYKLKMNDISNLEMFFPTDICYKNYILSLKKVKATVNEKDLEKQEEFTREFGQED